MGRTGKTPYQAQFEVECEAARKVAQKFFLTLLEEAHKLPRKKLIAKAPAALAAAYALVALLETKEAHTLPSLRALTGTLATLFEAELARSLKS